MTDKKWIMGLSTLNQKFILLQSLFKHFILLLKKSWSGHLAKNNVFPFIFWMRYFLVEIYCGCTPTAYMRHQVILTNGKKVTFFSFSFFFINWDTFIPQQRSLNKLDSEGLYFSLSILHSNCIFSWTLMGWVHCRVVNHGGQCFPYRQTDSN